MIVGHAAGAVAALAVNTTLGHVHDIDTGIMREVLLRGNMLLDDSAGPKPAGGK